MRTTPFSLFGNQKSVKAPPGNAAHFFTQGRQHRDLMGIVLKFKTGRVLLERTIAEGF